MARQNEYVQGEQVRIRAVFTDPATTTVLTGQIKPGVTSLPVEAGIIGAGFAAGAVVRVGDDLLTVGAGASASAIPITSPLTHIYPAGTEVGLVVDPAGPVVFQLRTPGAGGSTWSTSSPTPTKLQGGVYESVASTPHAGTYYYRAEAGPGVTAGGERSFKVKPSSFS